MHERWYEWPLFLFRDSCLSFSCLFSNPLFFYTFNIIIFVSFFVFLHEFTKLVLTTFFRLWKCELHPIWPLVSILLNKQKGKFVKLTLTLTFQILQLAFGFSARPLRFLFTCLLFKARWQLSFEPSSFAVYDSIYIQTVFRNLLASYRCWLVNRCGSMRCFQVA